MDDDRQTIRRERARRAPDAAHPPAGRVDDAAADAAQLQFLVDIDAERGNDHQVLSADLREPAGRSRRREAPHARLHELGVDRGVVDDLARHPDAHGCRRGRRRREFAGRRQRAIDRALDALAKPEGLREIDAQAGQLEAASRGAQLREQRQRIAGWSGPETGRRRTALRTRDRRRRRLALRRFAHDTSPTVVRPVAGRKRTPAILMVPYARLPDDAARARGG